MNKKLGYYTVGKKELESKIHACIFATHIANNVKENVDPLSLVKWHFNEDIFPIITGFKNLKRHWINFIKNPQKNFVKNMIIL